MIAQQMMQHTATYRAPGTPARFSGNPYNKELRQMWMAAQADESEPASVCRVASWGLTLRVRSDTH